MKTDSSINPEIDIEIIEGIKLIRKSMPTGIQKVYDLTTKFLELVSYLLDYKKSLEDEAANIKADLETTHTEVFLKAEGSVTDRRQIAKANEACLDLEVHLAKYTTEIERIKGYVRLFENAHITTRQFIKD